MPAFTQVWMLYDVVLLFLNSVRSIDLSLLNPSEILLDSRNSDPKTF